VPNYHGTLDFYSSQTRLHTQWLLGTVRIVDYFDISKMVLSANPVGLWSEKYSFLFHHLHTFLRIGSPYD